MNTRSTLLNSLILATATAILPSCLGQEPGPPPGDCTPEELAPSNLKNQFALHLTTADGMQPIGFVQLEGDKNDPSTPYNIVYHLKSCTEGVSVTEETLDPTDPKIAPILDSPLVRHDSANKLYYTLSNLTGCATQGNLNIKSSDARAIECDPQGAIVNFDLGQGLQTPQVIHTSSGKWMLEETSDPSIPFPLTIPLTKCINQIGSSPAGYCGYLH